MPWMPISNRAEQDNIMRVAYTIASWPRSDCSAGRLPPNDAVPRERTRLYSVLEHGELNRAVINFT